MKSGDDRSSGWPRSCWREPPAKFQTNKLLCTRGDAKVHAHLLTTTAAAALLAASSAQASRIFQEQPCRRTNGSRPFGLPLPKRPRLRATASAALNLAARIALPVIVLNGVSGVASAQNATWNGPGADWNTSANWICDCPRPERKRRLRRGFSDGDFYGRQRCRRQPSIHCTELCLQCRRRIGKHQRHRRRGQFRKCANVQCSEYCWRNPCDQFQWRKLGRHGEIHSWPSS